MIASSVSCSCISNFDKDRFLQSGNIFQSLQHVCSSQPQQKSNCHIFTIYSLIKGELFSKTAGNGSLWTNVTQKEVSSAYVEDYFQRQINSHWQDLSFKLSLTSLSPQCWHDEVLLVQWTENWTLLHSLSVEVCGDSAPMWSSWSHTCMMLLGCSSVLLNGTQYFRRTRSLLMCMIPTGCTSQMFVCLVRADHVWGFNICRGSGSCMQPERKLCARGSE